MVIKKSRKQYSKTFKTSFIDSYKNQELNLYSYCLKVNDCANRWTKAVTTFQMEVQKVVLHRSLNTQ